jgi:UTP--glucose-1-phosphate uridylyltransferase
MNNKVTRALIPAGGYGTRFLPASRSIPKEMFPLWNKPIVLHVVEELVSSGIENIVFVVSSNKHSLEDFFSSDESMETYLVSKDKLDQVGELKRIQQLANFSFIYTKPPGGNGGAVLSAKEFLNNEPFVVAWGDEVVLTKGKPRILQCLEVFEKYNDPVISAVEIEHPAERQNYGMAKFRQEFDSKGVGILEEIVEKPKEGTEPSKFATHGAYILTPDIFDTATETFIDPNGELWLTDMINSLAKKRKFYAKNIEDYIYLDCGTPKNYLESQIKYSKYMGYM